jgi:hypothetical protein
MRPRQKIGLTMALVPLLAGAALWMLLGGRSRPTASPAVASASAAAVWGPPPGKHDAPALEFSAPERQSALPPEHFAEKRRRQEEAAAALREIEERKYANVDFSAPRPGPPPPRAPVQGKNEEGLTDQEKLQQLGAIQARLKERMTRVSERAAEAKRKGDAGEQKKQETLLHRLELRDASITRRSRVIRGEPVAPEPASAGSAGALEPDPSIDGAAE